MQAERSSDESLRPTPEERLRTALKVLRAARKKEEATLGKQREELARAAGWEHDRHIADSLLSDLGSYPRGTGRTLVLNVHSQEYEEVALNVKLDGRENADLLYRKARRGERGMQECEAKVRDRTERIAVLDTRIAALESALSGDAPPDEKQLDALCGDVGPVADRGAGATEKKTDAEKVPYRHFTLDGWSIYVGRNDAQNDELSTRFTRPWWIWMHVAAHAGSHVAVRREKNAVIPPHVLEVAAGMAVWYSKARHTSFAEVHVTEGRFVSKRRKSPPGQVVLGQYRTMRVVPVDPQKYFRNAEGD